MSLEFLYVLNNSIDELEHISVQRIFKRITQATEIQIKPHFFEALSPNIPFENFDGVCLLDAQWGDSAEREKTIRAIARNGVIPFLVHEENSFAEELSASTSCPVFKYSSESLPSPNEEVESVTEQHGPAVVRFFLSAAKSSNASSKLDTAGMPTKLLVSEIREGADVETTPSSVESASSGMIESITLDASATLGPLPSRAAAIQRAIDNPTASAAILTSASTVIRAIADDYLNRTRQNQLPRGIDLINEVSDIYLAMANALQRTKSENKQLRAEIERLSGELGEALAKLESKPWTDMKTGFFTTIGAAGAYALVHVLHSTGTFLLNESMATISLDRQLHDIGNMFAPQ